MACAISLLLSCALLADAPSQTSPTVDLELVLAADASYSMDRSGRHFQRDGYAQAFRSADVIEAATSGAQRRIAVTLIEWSGQGDQTIVVPWTIIGDEASASAFADAIDAAALERRRGGLTAVGDALLFSARQIIVNDIAGARRVIDISGNGAGNEGTAAAAARAAILREGITINALPVPFQMTADGAISSSDRHEPSVETYYREHVVGGPGSFVMSVSTEDGFAEAIHRKLVKEIASDSDYRVERSVR